jgi:hypothetical protein
MEQNEINSDMESSPGRISSFVVIAKFLMILGLVSFGCHFVIGFFVHPITYLISLFFYLPILLVFLTGFGIGVAAIIVVISKKQPAKALYSAVNSTVICGFSAIVTTVLVYVLYISKALGH